MQTLEMMTASLPLALAPEHVDKHFFWDAERPSLARELRAVLPRYEGAWLTIEKVQPERSTSQLRMYRAWLHQVSEQTGNDEEELHAFLLERCAPRVVTTIKAPKQTADVEQMKRTSGGHKLSMDRAR
jgi:hypothetical protein